MQRNTTFIALALLLPLFLIAQNDSTLATFNADRLHLNQVGMTVLGSWALGNMAVSGLALSSSSGATRSFHQMNIGWNAVNLAIAGFGYYGAISGATDLSLASSIQEHESIKRILLFNAGLDVAYMAGGLYLLERSKNDLKQKDRLTGFGRAVIMNGAFLFVFDVVMYALHTKQGASDLYPWLENIQLSATGVGVQFMF
jgi:hypothetical protein